MKIVFTDLDSVTTNDLSIDAFQNLGEVTTYPFTNFDQVAERVKDADIVLCNKTPMVRETLKDAKNLKLISVLATGYNNVDMEYIKEQGITLCNAGGYSTNAVAQHVFALLLHTYSRIADYNEFVNNGEWMNSKLFSPYVFPCQELQEKTIGIVGYGCIGQAVAKIANAFDMKVIVYNRSKKEDANVTFVDFDTLVATADVVTVHCPLNEESAHMFHKDVFVKMKKNAFFINTARGGVVVEKDLLLALENKVIMGAALDVLDKEPMAKDCPLFQVKNLTITPHVAWTPLDTRRRLLQIAFTNVKGYLEGKTQNVIHQK